MKRDLSNLPSAKSTEPHVPPTSTPLFAAALVDAWAEAWVPKANKPTAVPCRVRHSDAGRCGRYLAYKDLNVPVSNELTVADHYRFHVGNLVHDTMQDIARARWPEAEIEFVTAYDGTRPVGDDGVVLSSGRGDMMIVHDADQRRYAVELKSINGFGFQRAIGLKGNAEGPRLNALLQGAINAYLAAADVLVIMYVSLDCIAAGTAAAKKLEPWQRFLAEWHYETNQFEPIAMEELDRLDNIVVEIDAGLMPARHMPSLPPGATIVNPAKGLWTVTESGRIFDTGSTWECNYCAYQTKCVADAEAGL